MIRFFRRRVIAAHHREIGRLGGRARAEQMRAPFREKARELRRECGLPEAEVLG